jgi:hypothetical protein
MKKLLLSTIFLIILSGSLFAQENDGFTEFLAGFKTAVKEKDKNKVAEMTTFPLQSFDFASYAGLKGGASEIDKDTFLKNYKKIFTSSRVKTLLSKEPVKSELYGEEEPTYTLVYISEKTYACWLVFTKDEAGTWKLVFTDNISYE